MHTKQLRGGMTWEEKRKYIGNYMKYASRKGLWTTIKHVLLDEILQRIWIAKTM